MKYKPHRWPNQGIADKHLVTSYGYVLKEIEGNIALLENYRRDYMPKDDCRILYAITHLKLAWDQAMKIKKPVLEKNPIYKQFVWKKNGKCRGFFDTDGKFHKHDEKQARAPMGGAFWKEKAGVDA